MSCAFNSKLVRHASNWARFVKPSLLFFLAVLAGCAHENAGSRAGKIVPVEAAAPSAPVAPATVPIDHTEQVRKDCIEGRRLICGKVLRVSPDGLVVESGYTDLLRPPLTESWIVPGTVSAHRNPAVLELNEPGTACIGLAFLTDIPKRQKVKLFDYVIIMGYPAGQYIYTPAPNVGKTIRKFAAGLDTAVRLNLQAEGK
jgi:hypothetical protein